ncbi:hypothetical protein M8445_17370 (plasmid) [Deinococcus aquaticus]|uniref:Uncharacterized protein n=1 Tax=Deinococcus aquaticus TaxID=328692 RepID=A0ABY7V6A3_9DEIO|nr:hypothetical protein [Deinococcus aquaticus]WDA60738.1 hypothetical protein M8445_17370 [Deinococcus aquaticus]
MKAILLKGDGDFELKIEADFSNSLTGEAGDVRVQAEGIDVDTREDFPPAVVYGWFSPAQAREVAQALTEMADRAEQGKP